MQEKEEIYKEIKRLSRIADQNRSIYCSVNGKVSVFVNFLQAFVAIGAAITSMFIFVKDPGNWLGYFSAAVFVAGVIQPTFNLDSKIRSYTIAVQEWGKWIRDAHNFLSTKSCDLPIENLRTKKDQLVESYKDVMSATPIISDKKFLKYKRLHLQKVEVSKVLDLNPFKSVREIKKELKESLNFKKDE